MIHLKHCRVLKQSPGDLTHYTMSFIALFLVAVVMLTTLVLRRTQTSKALLEDGLAAATLASALPDTHELAKNGTLLITDSAAAWAAYQNALRSNYGLTPQYEAVNSAFVSGRVELLEYRIYNVEESSVSIISINTASGAASESSGALGSVVTPNGITVQHTTVYAKIGLNVKSLSVKWPGVTGNPLQYVTLSKAVDLVEST